MGKKRKTLGRVELAVLQYVVEHHPVPVKEVAEFMAASSGHARTTILTVLERLREKKFLVRKKINGLNHYQPTVSKSQFLQERIGEFVDDVLQGSVSPFVAFLNDNAQLSDEECDQLKAIIERLDSDKR